MYLKMVKVVNFRLHILYHNKKRTFLCTCLTLKVKDVHQCKNPNPKGPTRWNEQTMLASICCFTFPFFNQIRFSFPHVEFIYFHRKEKLMRCSQCRVAKYCGAKCQVRLFSRKWTFKFSNLSLSSVMPVGLFLFLRNLCRIFF